MSAVNWVRAKLIDVFEKKNPVNKHLKDKIYFNGEDNLYPNTLRNVINESPTAKRCSNLMAKFIIGKGVTIDKDITKNYTLNDLCAGISRSVSYDYASIVWVGYKIDEQGKFVKTNHKVLDYAAFRKQINDDIDGLGKVIISNWQNKANLFGKDKDKTEQWYYPFNDNQEVIRAQIEADYGKSIESEEDMVLALKKYKGQIMHINLTPEYHYALPPWDSVYNDMNSEAQISRYINAQTRKGFIGKTAVVTVGLDKDTQEQVDADMKGFLGTENSCDVWSLSLEAGANIDECIKFMQLPAQFDDKLFEKTKLDLFRNISGQWNNIPKDLIYASEGLFGQNADKYNEIKKFYWEQNDYERKFIINRLWELGFENVEFIPLYTTEFTDNSEEIRQKSQAELKGSVGGVTALITLQQSVANGTTDINSAIEIVKEIYGINEEIARKMLGQIEVNENANNNSNIEIPSI